MTENNDELIWTPSPEFASRSGLARFTEWLESERGLYFEDYRALWSWSVDDLDAFWQSIWDYFEVESSVDPAAVLGDRTMPGAQWFPGARVNFARHVLRQRRDGVTAIVHQSELRPMAELGWSELADRVATLGEFLRRHGVRPGDRVAAVLPNTPEAMTTLLASTAVGAIFSGCSPDFGQQTILDRFQQIEPRFLFVCDGYRFGGKNFDRRELARRLITELPSVETVVFMPYLFGRDTVLDAPNLIGWDEALSDQPVSIDAFEFEDVAFDHPLWIVYSSGTTGVPKAMVHSHGGVTLEYLKSAHLHLNLGPQSRLFFYTTTGWMMFNALFTSLMAGGQVVLYDGNPMAPEVDNLWQIADASGATVFGASPAFVEAMKKHNVRPKDRYTLARLEMVMLSGSPASSATFRWFKDAVKDDLWVTSQSGGTDIVSGFVGSVPTLPVYAGEIQARYLGCDVQVLDEQGGELIGEVGELVVKKPMPSMPIHFWGDPQGERYRDSYFDKYPGRWRHGDFMVINERGSCAILGRSDATLNRHGVRIGTAEIYRIVETVDGIADSLVVDLERPDGTHYMPLFVSMGPEAIFSSETVQALRTALRTQGSPRHVPDEIIEVPEIPYTLTRKKLEVPLRKILVGVPVAEAVSMDAVANPACVEWFVRWASQTGLTDSKSAGRSSG